jgi:hypothetical protein
MIKILTEEFQISGPKARLSKQKQNASRKMWGKISLGKCTPLNAQGKL